MTNAQKLTVYLWVTACALLVGFFVAFYLLLHDRWFLAWCALAAAFTVSGAMIRAEDQTVYDMEGEKEVD